jgi:hypothetical protein
MNRIIIITLFISLLLLNVSCDAQKASVKKKQKSAKAITTKVITTPKDTANCAVLVSFYSIGSGTNREAYDKFRAFIEKTNKAKKITLNIGATPWGREGEVDYCFKLKELNAANQKKFISDLKKLLKGADYVRIEEDKPNTNKR